MQLLEDRVLVKLYPKVNRKTATGIDIPDTAKGEPDKGKVVKVGNGYTVLTGDRAGEVIPMTVKEGDEVIFEEGIGREITYEDEKVLLMLQADILAIV